MDPLLQELIGFPSVCSNIPEANRIIDYFEPRLKDLGLHVERFERRRFPSLVATSQKTKTPKVMLYAHLDVVEAPGSLFSLRLEDGKYYGRGVLDMKSAAANYMHILNDIQENLTDYDIGIMLTTDEEYFGMYGAGMLASEGYLPQVCIMPDSVFGTNWDIENFAKGCWFAHITSLGISAHGSRPWEGDSASIKLVHAVDQISELFKDMQQPNTATLNVGLIRGGASINQIPAAAMASLDIRFTDYKVYQRLKRSIGRICDRNDVNLRTVRKANKPTYNDIEHPLVKAFTQQVAKQIGVLPKPFSAHGATDARFYADKGGALHTHEPSRWRCTQ